MSPQRLAMRTLLLGRTRSVLAILLMAASLCVLDLFAGHIASGRARLAYHAVVNERLGHLQITPVAKNGERAEDTMFDPQQIQKISNILRSESGIARFSPHISVSGVAANGARSALFTGDAVVPVAVPGERTHADADGKPDAAVSNGVVVSDEQALLLGLQIGSSLTLTAVSHHGATTPVTVRVVKSLGIERGGRGRAMLMPLALAQSMLNTDRVPRIDVYLDNLAMLDERRATLASSLRAAALDVRVHTWQEQSALYARDRSAADLSFDSLAGMVFAVIAATIAATLSINGFERRREVGTLRALGMRSHAVFLMFVIEALWMTALAIAASLVASSLIAWVVNRVVMSDNGCYAAGHEPTLLELDFERIFMAMVAVLAVALLAALVPAFKAARAAIAPALAA